MRKPVIRHRSAAYDAQPGQVGSLAGLIHTPFGFSAPMGRRGRAAALNADALAHVALLRVAGKLAAARQYLRYAREERAFMSGGLPA